jgi:AraC-like DNA-binding protein
MTDGSAPSPGLRTLVDSHDLDETRDIISSAYSPYDLSCLGRTADFSAWYAEGGFPGVTISDLAYGAETLVAPEPLSSYLLVCQLTEGRVRVLSPGREERDVAAGQLYVLDPYRSFKVHWQPGARMVTIRLPRDLVERAAADSLGVDGQVKARFTLGPAISPEAGKSWWRVADTLQREVMEGGIAMTSRLVATNLAQTAAATLVETHRLVTDGVDSRRPGVVAHAAVRRAVLYMEEHAHEPLTLREVAAAARLSPRALQEAFRRHLDTTPLAYLRDIRLVRAHGDLAAGTSDPRVTVTGVAYQWGFTNLGRFSALYQQRYGRPPSGTLRG